MKKKEEERRRKRRGRRRRRRKKKEERRKKKESRIFSNIFKIPKMDGIFHYFNESFVIDPLNDFERHFAWLSKTSLLLKIG